MVLWAMLGLLIWLRLASMGQPNLTEFYEVFLTDLCDTNLTSQELSYPLLTRFREIVSGCPTYVYDGNRLLLLILRQKVALSDVWSLLTCWMVVDMGIKIRYLQVVSPVVAEGSWWSRWRWWWVRPSWASHKSMQQGFEVPRVKRQNAILNRRPSAYTYRGGRGALFSPKTSHVIWKWTFNATLAMGRQANLAHC